MIANIYMYLFLFMLQPINVNTIFCGIVIIKLLILYVQIFHSKISIFLVVVFFGMMQIDLISNGTLKITNKISYLKIISVF